MIKYLAAAGLVILLGVGGYFVWQTQSANFESESSSAEPSFADELPVTISLKPGENFQSKDGTFKLSFEKIFPAEIPHPDKGSSPEMAWMKVEKGGKFIGLALTRGDSELHPWGAGDPPLRCRDMGDVRISITNIDWEKQIISVQINPVSHEELVQWCNSQPG